MVTHTDSSRKKDGKSGKTLWFAHSATRGWVLLDRNIAVNRFNEFPEDFVFTRCADGTQFVQGEADWDYQEAGRYLEQLPLGKAARQARELENWRNAYAA